MGEKVEEKVEVNKISIGDKPTGAKIVIYCQIPSENKIAFFGSLFARVLAELARKFNIGDEIKTEIKRIDKKIAELKSIEKN